MRGQRVTGKTQKNNYYHGKKSLLGHFPLGGISRAERHLLLFEDQLAESGHQKTKENIIPRGKFRLVFIYLLFI